MSTKNTINDINFNSGMIKIRKKNKKKTSFFFM